MPIMKRILFIAIAVIFSLSSDAQMQINFNINHTLSGSTFALNQQDQNDLMQNFEFSRVQYYVNGITLIHDGGQQIPLNDSLIFFVDASVDVTEYLGVHLITSLEGIKFHIGVDSPLNHTDPAVWPNGHPLSPKLPAMNWGWASGNRFAAIEGNAGPTLNTNFQVHALGNWNYFEQTVMFASPKTGNYTHVNLDADYTQAVRGLNIASGIVEHGGANEAIDVLENFRDHVFSESSWPTEVKDLSKEDVLIYPNPSNGLVNISTVEGAQTLILRNACGQLLSKMPILSQRVELNIETPGLYYIEVQSKNSASVLQKLVVR